MTAAIRIPAYAGMMKNVSPADLAYFAARMLREGFDVQKVAETIEFESAKSWDPKKNWGYRIQRKDGTSYQAPVGLLQFTGGAGGGAAAAGTTQEKLAKMTFREQLEPVVRYFKNWPLARLNAPNGLNNYHLAGWGDNVGGHREYVLADRDGRFAWKYGPNAALDKYDPSGKITAGELDRVTTEAVWTSKTVEIIPSEGPLPGQVPGQLPGSSELSEAWGRGVALQLDWLLTHRVSR